MRIRCATALIFIALIFITTMAVAQDRPPQLRVLGGAEHDVLNLHAEPDAQSEIVGDLAPDATGIEVVAQAIDGLDWLLVDTGAVRGWANANFFAYDNGGAPSHLPVRLVCFGTEPFWGIELGYGRADAELVFDDRRATLALGAPVPARGRFQPWLLSGLDADDRDSFVMVEERNCSDSMSDLTYPFTAQAQIDGTFLSGCCR